MFEERGRQFYVRWLRFWVVSYAECIKVLHESRRHIGSCGSDCMIIDAVGSIIVIGSVVFES